MTKTDLLNQLKRHEGCVKSGDRHTAYQDHLGYWTIGYGRLIDKSLGGGLTEMEALHLLANDVNEVIRELYSPLPWIDRLDSVRFYSLVNMAFNMGVPRLLGFEKMLAAMKNGEYDRAAEEAMDSKWAKQVGMRAVEISAQIRTGLSADDVA